ncbi:hypothetical protein O181_045418 [Austropuccinia psidii MF-1]|uniref:CCHC-type domain-containing protein n=1 Tax=Austropuccinia psidii MF-1 TaxID=1389203 RepID=A0A9Q3HHL1_9BASI|nr:hypothetical protein [Austropuccinia psidii MF-1]
MKPQPQGHALEDPYHQEDIKPVALLGNKARSPSQYQDGDNMSYSEQEALKQLSKAFSFPKLSGTGEYDHMELIDYIDGIFIDVLSIPDYWITDRFNTSFKSNSIIWYTEMKEVHVRRSWPLWKSQIIQKYSNGTWIWQNTMSFENDKYSVENDPYEWCLRQSKRLEVIEPVMNNQMRNHKLLTKPPGVLDHAVKCRGNQSCTLDDIANTLQDVIGKYSQFRRSFYQEKQPFRVDIKDKPKEKMAEVTKNKNTCHNCGLAEHHSNNCPKAKEKAYSIEQFTEAEYPKEDFESDSMGDAIREQSDDYQDPREELLVEN